jgi:lysophospholipase L1-like esterase
MKRALQNTAIFLVSCLVALVGIEIGLAFWGPDVIRMGSAFTFHRFDPVLGWDNLEGATGQFTRLEFSYPVRINANGMWDAEIEPKAPSEFRVAVLGDSFTWGLGAAYGTRFTEVVEVRNPRINVLNFGVTAFSPIQHMQRLDQVFALKPDYVVVALCIANDLFENTAPAPYSHPKPYARLSATRESFKVLGYPLPENEKVGSYLFGSMSWSRIVGLIKLYVDDRRVPEALRKVDLGHPTKLYIPLDKLEPRDRDQVRDAFRLNELILQAMKRRTDAEIGPRRFAVLLVPTLWDYPGGVSRPDAEHDTVAREVLAGLARLGIATIDGRTVIAKDDFWKHDMHWRPSGHQKIGELLADFLTQAVTELPPPETARSVD